MSFLSPQTVSGSCKNSQRKLRLCTLRSENLVNRYWPFGQHIVLYINGVPENCVPPRFRKKAFLIFIRVCVRKHEKKRNEATLCLFISFWLERRWQPLKLHSPPRHKLVLKSNSGDFVAPKLFQFFHFRISVGSFLWNRNIEWISWFGSNTSHFCGVEESWEAIRAFRDWA